jgi:hypothetical protein
MDKSLKRLAPLAGFEPTLMSMWRILFKEINRIFGGPTWIRTKNKSLIAVPKDSNLVSLPAEPEDSCDIPFTMEPIYIWSIFDIYYQVNL